MSESWYNHIEPGIRPVVRLLRDNGWNTTCSCEHEMYVDVDLHDLGDAERLATFLFENCYRKFHMAAELFVPSDGFWVRRVHITFWRDWKVSDVSSRAAE
jgi:hypothetical protein